MAPTRLRRPPRHALLPVAVAITLLAATCTDVSSDDSRSVRIFGVETGGEAESLRRAFEDFSQAHGISVEVEGNRDFETLIQEQVEGDNPPDIGLFPQPALVRELFDGDGDPPITPLRDLRVGDTPLDESVRQTFLADLVDLVTADGEGGGDLLAIPAKVDLKSLVWYRPDAFAANGYEVPETFEDFLALSDRMLADGHTPFCVGIESGDGSGWPVTDWIEDFVLRQEGADVYDRWVQGDVPFDDDRIVAATEAVISGAWRDGDAVNGGRDAAAAVSFAAAGLPLLYGECLMHRMSNFYTGEWPDDVPLAPDRGPDGGDAMDGVDVFLLPGSADRADSPALIGGNFAAAFSDDEETAAVMHFIAGPDFARARAEASRGEFLSPNVAFLSSDTPCGQGEADTGICIYPERIRSVTQRFAEILDEADPVRFDASDLMPSEVGSGTFWTAAVDMTVGAATVADALADVAASWPDRGAAP